MKWKKGKVFETKEKCSLCRCGASKNKPYCDWTHNEINFDRAETASREKYEEQAEFVDGDKIVLFDVNKFCSVARFCDLGKGAWQLAADSKNLKDKNLCIEESELCPSGRLVVVDKKTGKACEPKLEKEIGLVQDPVNKVSGPIWLKGSIPVESADGFEYEIRNRQTLCRCGKSSNKPFCDGYHIKCGFRDDI